MTSVMTIRPAAPIPGDLPHSPSGRGAASAGAASNIHGAERNPPAATAETAAPVPPAKRGERASFGLTGGNSLSEASRARLLAAQRAYVAAARAAGYNPLISRIP